ncbi:glutathione S-transferase N-terminal domain-containing protein [Sorangium sp. So ce1078]|uniref:glutathione S-transferase N-terminal domain-containing protein n=1 Tax=Sorangium sp. So ce1078 TaxID=3133329 RepID=UPI003F6042F7
MEENEIAKIINASQDALVAGDVDAYLAMMSDDVVVCDPSTPRLVGRDAVRRYIEGLLASFSEIAFLDRKVFPLGLGAAMRFTLRTRTADGRDGTLEGVDVFELNEQRKIAKITSYFDAPGAGAPAPGAGALEVYWGSGSPPAWRVLLLLAVKGVPYESKLLQLSKDEQKAPAYMAVSPRGKVPAIRDGAFCLHESLAIMAYLDRKYPSPPLFGDSAEEAGAIARVIAEHESYLYPALGEIARAVFSGNPAAIAKKEPAVRAAASALHDELAQLEASLAQRDYLAGPRLTAADLTVYPSIQLAVRVATRPAAAPLDLAVAPLAARYPRLAA